MSEVHGQFTIQASAASQDDDQHDRRESQFIAAPGELIDGSRWTVGGPNSSRSGRNTVIDFGYLYSACFLHLRGQRTNRQRAQILFR